MKLRMLRSRAKLSWSSFVLFGDQVGLTSARRLNQMSRLMDRVVNELCLLVSFCPSFGGSLILTLSGSARRESSSADRRE